MKRLLPLILLLFPIFCFAQLSELSDEFNKTCDLADWINLEDTEGWANTHLESYDVNTSNEGQLTMIPWTTAWFASRRSVLLYKNVSGDFVFSSEVTATNKDEDDQPGGAYSLAGLMIRTPKTVGPNGPIGSENYVFLSIGSASSNSTPQFEIKTTVNNSSSLNITNISGTTAKIRMVRKGGAIVVLRQLPGEDWVVQGRYDRSDMPTDVQIGFVTYSDWDKVNTYTIGFHNENTLNANLNPDPSSNPSQPFNPDIIGKFEYARFDSVVVPPAYDLADFSDPAEVPNSVILDIFGYDSTSDDLEGWKIWEGSNDNWSDASNWHDGIIPTNQDSILIPNCGCPEVVFPHIVSGIHTYASMVIEEGGQVDISANVTLNIDLSGAVAQFRNYGTLENSGEVNIVNSLDKTVINQGTSRTNNGGQFNIEE